MKQFMSVLVLLCLSAAVPTVSGDDAKKPKVPREKLDPQKVKALMHKKLDNAEKILAALTMNDLDKTGKSAPNCFRSARKRNSSSSRRTTTRCIATSFAVLPRR